MDSFFELSQEQAKRPIPLIPRCGRCALYKSCQTPKMPLCGEGKKRILIVGDFITAGDDERGKPFSGDTGSILKDALSQFGISLYKDCWITNALICAPISIKQKELTDRVDYCRPNVIKIIKEKKPHIIILLGKLAVDAVVGSEWKQEKTGDIERWCGFRIPSQKYNAWVCPVYSPLEVIIRKSEVLDDVFLKQIRDISKLINSPVKKYLPDYNSKIRFLAENETIFNIDRYIKQGGTAAFDIESNCLKPESRPLKGEDKTLKPKIYYGSICFEGHDAIAFYWTPRIAEAMKRFVTSDNIKIVLANLKMERRWMQRILGVRIKHIIWDTVLASHVLDNREGGTNSLKFQMYVTFGISDYEYEVSSYLESDTGHFNRVSEAPSQKMMLYNGLDSYFTYWLAKVQFHKMRKVFIK